MSRPKGIPGAVLTGDIVNSTSLSPPQEARLLEVLAGLLQEHPHEFYRGDSFQAYVKEPSKALQLALACRAVAIEITTREDGAARGDIRIAIGIGEVTAPVHAPGSAKGEAFVLSGRELDKLQATERRLSIVSGNQMADIGFQTMADYLDSIFQEMTAKQADVIANLLKGVTQQQLALSLEKAKSTISELANAGRWPAIERILQQYTKMTELLS
ncbi:MAG TPA: hypothetical protein VMH27_02195 [Puia sp.]|nr:hypothetical protein [Puia sp.]